MNQIMLLTYGLLLTIRFLTTNVGMLYFLRIKIVALPKIGTEEVIEEWVGKKDTAEAPLW